MSAKKIFTGKIHAVETKITETGHSLGEVVVKKLSDDEVEQDADRGLGAASEDWTEVRVPFMNENLAIYAKGADGSEKVCLNHAYSHIYLYLELTWPVLQVLATVPDLICILDVSTGEAIGIQEYRYGVKVVIMIMAPHPVWATKRGLDIAGPKAFMLPESYSSSLVYSKPKSVIEEFLPVDKDA